MAGVIYIVQSEDAALGEGVMGERQTNHVMHMVKVRRAGERFWAEIMERRKDGSMLARCDNDTIGAEAPRYNELFEIGSDEPILDSMTAASKLKVVR